MKNCAFAALIQLLCACSSGAARPSATAPATPADPLTLLAKPSADADLALSVWHHVVSPQEIRGVIVLRHIGREPVSLVERQMSWGTNQWMAVVNAVDKWSNPQSAWRSNFFAVTDLANHGTWAVPFVLCSKYTYEPQTWEFKNLFNLIYVMDSEAGTLVRKELVHHQFTTATKVQFILDAQKFMANPGDGKTSPRLYFGQLSATSSGVVSAEELAKHLTGADGKPLATLR